MNLQDTISFIIKEQGASALQSPALLGMLEDFGAFKEEEPSTRTIMRELIRSGQVRKLLESQKKGRDLQFEVKTIIADTVQACGFREDAVSETLKKVALASGKITKDKDWPEFTPAPVQTVPVTQQSQSTTSTPSQPTAKPVQANKSSARRAGSFILPTIPTASNKTGIDRLVTWLKKKDGKISIARVLALISAIMAIIALVGVVVCLVTYSPKIGEWLWTLGCSIFNVFLFASF